MAIAVIILTAMGLDQVTQTLMQTQQDNSGMTVHSSDDKFLTRDELQQKATAAEFNEQMPLSEALLSYQYHIPAKSFAAGQTGTAAKLSWNASNFVAS